jgi:Ca-activated chloride channel homolog
MRNGVRRARGLWLVCGLVSFFVTGLLWACQPERAGAAWGVGAGGEGGTKSAAPRELEVDLDKAVVVNLPAAAADLKPVAFKTSDGREGWVVRLPGGRPLATPAYADGLLFVGGGYGSHEFYAFDAATGALRWQTKTSDDGPTAAVTEDGLVAFNTESCTLIVVDAKTGKLVWQEWLGDPLMSQPAISKGRVFIAYPAGQRGANKRIQQGNKSARGGDSEERGSHRLLCADLRTGKHLWERAISGDVISAPVIDDERVYFTTFDGTSYALGAADGRVVWKKQNAGTSAPLVARGQVVVTRKEKAGRDSYEGVAVLDGRGEAKGGKLIAREKAGYLDEGSGGGVALTAQQEQSLDSSVGFGGGAPAAAKLDDANRHLGVKTVAGGWAYQGSRAAYSRGRVLNAQGRYLNSVSASDGQFVWRAELKGREVAEGAQVFSPPALGERAMYLAGSLGHLLAVGQQDGSPRFLYHFGVPLVFQPALVGGNVYVGTTDGLLICLKTGDADADGWYAWGGNAQHNKSK